MNPETWTDEDQAALTELLAEATDAFARASGWPISYLRVKPLMKLGVLS